MSTIESEVVAAVASVAPSSVAVQAAEAVISTTADPSPLNIVADLELAIKLVSEFKTKLAGLHPSIANIIKALF